MSDLAIGVIGAAGRMGRALVREVAATEACRLSAACERPGHEAIGADAGIVAGLEKLNVAIGDDAERVFRDADAVLEFTSPEATVAHAAMAARHGSAHVIGTTGLSEKDQSALKRSASETAIVWAPNMSLGVNLLIALTEQVARSLGDAFDIEIVEMHHRHKVDAPSGTALALGEAAAKGRDVALDAVSERGRDGVTGPRAKGAIGFAVLRGGDVVGEHTVMFAGAGERVALTHKATDREIFAAGAVRSALWAAGRKPGFYGMRDVLGL